MATTAKKTPAKKAVAKKAPVASEIAAPSAPVMKTSSKKYVAAKRFTANGVAYVPGDIVPDVETWQRFEARVRAGLVKEQ